MPISPRHAHSAPADVLSTGSPWNPNGRMSDMATDAKARYVGDLVTINIAESTNSAQQEGAQTSRAFSASSSLAALIGQPIRAPKIFSPRVRRNRSTQGANGPRHIGTNATALASRWLNNQFPRSVTSGQSEMC